jgi:hypothetical protein
MRSSTTTSETRQHDNHQPQSPSVTSTLGPEGLGVPSDGTWPKGETKIERNRERDADTDSRLAEAGWLSVRVWEHEDPAMAAGRVLSVVRGTSTT